MISYYILAQVPRGRVATETCECGVRLSTVLDIRHAFTHVVGKWLTVSGVSERGWSVLACVVGMWERVFPRAQKWISKVLFMREHVINIRSMTGEQTCRKKPKNCADLIEVRFRLRRHRQRLPCDSHENRVNRHSEQIDPVNEASCNTTRRCRARLRGCGWAKHRFDGGIERISFVRSNHYRTLLPINEVPMNEYCVCHKFQRQRAGTYAYSRTAQHTCAKCLVLAQNARKAKSSSAGVTSEDIAAFKRNTKIYRILWSCEICDDYRHNRFW